MDNSFYSEYVDPFDSNHNYWVRVEHLGRYLWSLNYIDKNDTVLDIACADGYGAKLISKHAKQVIGIDRNMDYINIAKDRYNSNNIIYKVLDVDIETIEGLYEKIVCFETLEHVHNPKKFLDNLYLVLKKDGYLLLSVPNKKYEELDNGGIIDPYHLNVFKYQELKDLILKIGFKIDEVLGQSFTNEIINNITSEVKKSDIVNDAKKYGIPNESNIEHTYSYIFVLRK